MIHPVVIQPFNLATGSCRCVLDYTVGILWYQLASKLITMQTHNKSILWPVGSPVAKSCDLTAVATTKGDVICWLLKWGLKGWIHERCRKVLDWTSETFLRIYPESERDNTSKKICKRLGLLKRSKRFLTSRERAVFYNALVQAVLDYAACV